MATSRKIPDPGNAERVLHEQWAALPAAKSHLDGRSREMSVPPPPPPQGLSGQPPSPADPIDRIPPRLKTGQGELRTQELRGREDLILWVSVGAIVAGLFTWLVTLGSPPGLAVAVNYIALVIWTAACAALSHQRWPVGLICGRSIPWRFFSFTGPGAAVLALAIYAPFDRYTVRSWAVWDEQNLELTFMPGPIPWSDPVPEHGCVIRYETYRRWTDGPIYRKAVSYESSTGSLRGYGWSRPLMITEGPTSPGGQCHGRWVITFHGPETETEASVLTWHWYGEKISEAEWHARSK